MPSLLAFAVIHKVFLPSIRNVNVMKFPGAIVFAVFPTMRVSLISSPEIW